MVDILRDVSISRPEYKYDVYEELLTGLDSDPLYSCGLAGCCWLS